MFIQPTAASLSSIPASDRRLPQHTFELAWRRYSDGLQGIMSTHLGRVMSQVSRDKIEAALWAETLFSQAGDD